MNLCRHAFCFVCVWVYLAASVPGQATTRNVPGDYPTIQDAIDAAEDGDTVLLADGVYSEEFSLHAKSLIVKSAGGPENCIIEGPGCQRMRFQGIRQVRGIFEGITVNNMHCSQTIGLDGHLSIWGSAMDFKNCVFSNLSYTSSFIAAGIIYAFNSNLVFDNCTFVDNELDKFGVGTLGIFLFEQCSLTMLNCSFINNTDRVGLTFTDCYVTIDSCEFIGNHSDLNGGALSFSSSPFTIINSTFQDNSATREGGAIYMNLTTAAIIGGELGHGNLFSGNTAQSGNHIGCTGLEGTIFNAQYNHFSGLPNDVWISPITQFNLSNSTFDDPGITQDVYVSPHGDDSNDGLSPHNAFKTINHALKCMVPLPSQPLTIHLATGEYSPSVTGEVFPVILMDYLVFQGAGTGSTILNAEQTGPVVDTGKSHFSRMADLTITGGSQGGINCSSNTGSMFNTCLITGNQNDYAGGGVICNSHTTTVFENCVISSNTTSESGGGVYSSLSGNLFTNCEIYNNTSETGGGVYSGRSHMIFRDCIIRDNETEITGGGVTLWRSTTQLVNCVIEDNVSDCGGGIRLTIDDRSKVTNCIIRDNHAISEGGGINCEGSEPALTNNLIIGNSSGVTGGGFHFRYASPVITNCTVSSNIAEVGGGVSCREESNASINNSIIYFNHPLNIFVASDSTLSIEHSDIQGEYEGKGNFDADPHFIDLDGENLHLANASDGTQVRSPCIDAGKEMARDTIMDIAGNPVHLAEYSTRSDNGLDVGIVDMGYHYPVSQPNLTISAEIEMDSILYPDEYYSIVTWLFNPDDIRLNVPVVFALEIHGVFYFWPDWKPVFDVARMTLHKGSNYVEILPSTKFPAEPYPYIEDCQAYCAFLTDDLSSIAGEMDVHQWTLGSAPPSASN